MSDTSGVLLDDYDAATAKITQLRALLVAVTDDGFESFCGMDTSIQHDFLWLARDLATDVHTKLTVQVGCVRD